ncbi:sugar transferase [Lentibacillus sp. Marseille-P4043]|uniref:sugar transferase n=1 Tax=Lentibacillus sp. Marseille-P4043 TaxID=2040293 RepID=UPI002D774ACE|nr:sugar transferase [Lentibacillus sp. Marseille-P4043]
MKRIMDVVISFVLITIFSPIIVFVALSVRIGMGAPVLFKQQRPGLHNQLFYLYKFRTMTNQMEKNGEVLPDESRLTPFGKFLRKYSLDEFPQLLNVLKGEMSLVGPRPLLVEYLPLYNEEQLLRHTIKPGITGWAQVNGRNAITWEEKFKYDIWYVKNRTMLIDCKILLLTLLKVLKKEGINHQGTMTMEKFAGTKEVL